ncbi:ATP synthase [Terfezia boudieri ATCC MYA-4762]|uniref:ATP synthase subunit 4 n=1 Tax=Terfezia boudieri ATCC MYA-4762 TaxID=1051890 RepID=A0A3N4LTC3_9PEZI|nr:ATP synthase [Terfezia boudieri ATCC MYA-4762]
MSMRLSKGLIGAAARLRPTATLPRAIRPALVRYQSTSPNVPVDPKSKANSILDSLPGSTLASKAAILSATAGVSVAAISNELYVVNDETIVAFCLLSVFWAVGKYGGPAYAEWATAQSQKIKDILNSARADHTQAVKERIDSVSQLGSVVDVTKDLFAVSKETAELEAMTFELEQRVQFTNEVKSVLDSWVRYEAQVKQRQQKELAESLINKVKKELENPAVLKQILAQSVIDVEKIVQQKA